MCANRRAGTARFNKTPVVLLGLAVAFSLSGDVTIYAVLPVYYHTLGFSPIQVGLLLSANRWVRLISNQVARRVLERAQVPRVFAVVLSAGAAATLIYAAAPPFLVFLGARMLWGVCWSFIRHTGVMTSIASGPRRYAAGVLGVYNGVVQLGFIGGTLAGALLFDAFGYSTAFVAAALVSLTAVPLDFAGFRRLPPAGSAARDDRPAEPVRDPMMLLRGFITACVGTGLIISTLGFTLRTRFGSSIELGALVVGITTLNGFLIALNYVINSAGSPPLGFAIDRVGRRTAEVIAFAAGGAALAAAAFFLASPLLIPAVVLFFVATVVCKLALISQAGVNGSKSFARLMTASDLGAATGPLIGWMAIERAGSPDVVFAVGGVLYLIATISAAVKQRRP